MLCVNIVGLRQLPLIFPETWLITPHASVGCVLDARSHPARNASANAASLRSASSRAVASWVISDESFVAPSAATSAWAVAGFDANVLFHHVAQAPRSPTGQSSSDGDQYLLRHSDSQAAPSRTVSDTHLTVAAMCS